MRPTAELDYLIKLHAHLVRIEYLIVADHYESQSGKHTGYKKQ